MKKLLLLSIVLTATKLFAQTDNIALIPQPVSLTVGKGKFTLPEKITISSNSDLPEVKNIIAQLSYPLTTATGYPVTAANNSTTISLLLNKIVNSNIGNEGYQLSVTSNGVIISANKPSGLFYGVQTLLQLLPKEIESKKNNKAVMENSDS